MCSFTALKSNLVNPCCCSFFFLLLFNFLWSWGWKNVLTSFALSSLRCYQQKSKRARAHQTKSKSRAEETLPHEWNLSGAKITRGTNTLFFCILVRKSGSLARLGSSLLFSLKLCASVWLSVRRQRAGWKVLKSCVRLWALGVSSRVFYTSIVSDARWRRDRRRAQITTVRTGTHQTPALTNTQHTCTTDHCLFFLFMFFYMKLESYRFNILGFIPLIIKES